MIYFLIGIMVGVCFVGEAYDNKITKAQSIYIDEIEYKCNKILSGKDGE